MQTAKQLSVSLANKPGRLAAMLGAMSKAKVSFRALAVMDSGGRATVRFVPDDINAATKVLEENNLRFDPADVLLVEMPRPERGISQYLRKTGRRTLEYRLRLLLVQPDRAP